MAKIEFPFQYGTVHLYDELKHLALQEKHRSDQKLTLSKENCNQFIKTTKQIDTVLGEAGINRTAWYTYDSVAAFFGVINSIRKTGFLGRVLAFFLSPSSYFKYF